MSALQIHIRGRSADQLEIRIFSADDTGSPLAYQKRTVEDLQEVLDWSETDYYVSREFREDLMQMGRQLYEWLDGPDRYLARQLEEVYTGDLLLLAFSGEGDLGQRFFHLPWELLHDGRAFLVSHPDYDLFPIRWVQRKSSAVEPADRALRTLFMACSPIDVQPRLAFEEEEAAILRATDRLPLRLDVEETGNLPELTITLADQAEPYDVFHLSGHAGHDAEARPVFYTESDFGTVERSSAESIFQAIRRRRPSLLFLSGCKTAGAAQAGIVPSLAQDLVQKGIPHVLGWAQPVFDSTATLGAAELYKGLSQGDSIEEAALSTMRLLLTEQDKLPGWHLLRLYTSSLDAPTLITPGRHKVPARSHATLFLGDNGLVKVPRREAFIGRRRELQEALRVIRREEEKTGILVQGMGGVGKSSLVSRLCSRLSDASPVVLFGKIDERDLMGKLAEHLDPEAIALLNQPERTLRLRLRDALQAKQDTRRMLIVLDDFEQNLEGWPEVELTTDGLPRMRAEVASLLEDLLWACGNIRTNDAPKVLLTCRYQLDGVAQRDLHLLRLGEFATIERKKLYERKLAEATAKPSSELLTRIEDVAGGNPRLLEWLLEVVDQPGAIDMEELLPLLEAKEVAFRTDTLAQYLYESLDADARRAICLLAVYHISVPLAALSALDDNADWAGPLLKAGNLGLIEQGESKGEETRYRLPPVLRVILPEAEGGWPARATQFLYEVEWEENASESLALEIIRLGLLSRAKEAVVPVADELTSMWINTNRYRESFELLQRLNEVLPGQYQIQHNLARGAEVLGFVEEAFNYYQSAAELCDVETDPTEYGAILHNLANLHVHRGEVNLAMELYEESLRIKEQAGDMRGKGATLHQIALVYLRRGEVSRAMELYEESLRIKEQAGDLAGKGATLHAMAHVYVQRGEANRAMELYEESLRIREQMGDVWGKGGTLHAMAAVYVRLGDISRAMELYEESLQILEQVGDLGGKGSTLHSMADIYLQSGEVSRAIELYEEALRIREQIDDVRGKGVTLHAMAAVHARRGEESRAIELYEESLGILEQVGDLRGKGVSLQMMAEVYKGQGNIDRAIRMLEEALQIQELVGDLREKAVVLHAMADVYLQRGELNRAMELYQEALHILEQLENVQGKSATLQQMAQLYEKLSEFDKAKGLYLEAIELKEQVDDLRGLSVARHNLGLLLIDQEQDYQHGLPLLQWAISAAIQMELGEVSQLLDTIVAKWRDYLIHEKGEAAWQEVEPLFSEEDGLEKINAWAEKNGVMRLL